MFKTDLDRQRISSMARKVTHVSAEKQTSRLDLVIYVPTTFDLKSVEFLLVTNTMKFENNQLRKKKSSMA